MSNAQPKFFLFLKTLTIVDDKDDATNVMSNDFVLHHKLYIIVGIIGGGT